MERRKHRPQPTGTKFADPQLSRVVDDIYRSLPQGLNQTVTIVTTAATHTFVFSAGVLTEYREE